MLYIVNSTREKLTAIWKDSNGSPITTDYDVTATLKNRSGVRSPVIRVKYRGAATNQDKRIRGYMISAHGFVAWFQAAIASDMSVAGMVEIG